MGERLPRRDWFMLYRPTVGPRAQAIQVVNTAWALADAGHRVELCVQGGASEAGVLERYGLCPLPGLTLRRLARRNAPASWAYRMRLAGFMRRTGGRGVLFARSKRHAALALRLWPATSNLVLEVHEVDSVQAADAGHDPRAVRTLEEVVLRGARGVVANASGTLRCLRQAHGELPPAAVVLNGARPGRRFRSSRQALPAAVGCVGSLRAYKDPETVARAAARSELTVQWVGPTAHELTPFAKLSRGRLLSAPAIEPRDVRARLGQYRALLVPLSPGRFGEELTSPLKLWDALQSGVPLVAADTAAVREQARDAYIGYTPGSPTSLAQALRRACTDGPAREEVLAAARRRARTWADRARELTAFVDEVLE